MYSIPYSVSFDKSIHTLSWEFQLLLIFEILYFEEIDNGLELYKKDRIFLLASFSFDTYKWKQDYLIINNIFLETTKVTLVKRM